MIWVALELYSSHKIQQSFSCVTRLGTSGAALYQEMA